MYKEIINWELDLDKLEDNSIKKFTNAKEGKIPLFKFIKKSYREWLEYETNEIPLSNKLMKKRFFH